MPFSLKFRCSPRLRGGQMDLETLRDHLNDVFRRTPTGIRIPTPDPMGSMATHLLQAVVVEEVSILAIRLEPTT